MQIKNSDKKFKDSDNAGRLEKYRKDASEESFLDELNSLIQQLEPTELVSKETVFPIVFVVGLPRSGTTILTQLLSASLDVGIINNLIARFWLAPVTGIRLSKAILREQVNISFKSDYGKTSDITEPHEFSYFWHYWLKMENMPPYNPEEVRDEIDWTGLATTLRNMSAAWGKPLVMKAPDVAYHIEKIFDILPETLFIHIYRDLADTAVSMRRSRLEYFGDENVWLGAYPNEYESIADLEGIKQIAAQAVCLNRMYKTAIDKITEKNVMSVHLNSLCENPLEIVRSIGRRISELWHRDVNIKKIPPKSLKYSTYKGEKIYDQFLQEIEEYDLQ